MVRTDTEGLLANLGPGFENPHAVHGMAVVDQFTGDVSEDDCA
jgi:hypothetical protein